MIIKNHFNPDTNIQVAFYSQSPQKRLISFDPQRVSLDRQQYFLSFPTIVFKMTCKRSLRSVNRQGDFVLDSSHNFYSMGFSIVFSDLNNERFYVPSLYNIYSDDFNICCEYPDYEKSIEELLHKSIESFWNSSFSIDLTYNHLRYENSKRKNKKLLGDFTEWERKTKEDSNWVPTNKNMILLNSEEELNFKNVEGRTW